MKFISFILFSSTDTFNRIAIAVITACFICFAVFIVPLIVLKKARLHRKKKKQAHELNSGREEMAMLHITDKNCQKPPTTTRVRVNSPRSVISDCVLQRRLGPIEGRPPCIEV